MTDFATDTPGLSSAVLKSGQFGAVRRRQWIGSSVDESAVSLKLTNRNLVRFTLTEEEVLAEKSGVLWELEPGIHVIGRAHLPPLSALDDAAKRRGSMPFSMLFAGARRLAAIAATSRCSSAAV